MDFIEMWNEAIDNDPYWQFEELLEEDPEEAEAVWQEMRVWTLAMNRFNASPSSEGENKVDSKE